MAKTEKVEQSRKKTKNKQKNYTAAFIVNNVVFVVLLIVGVNFFVKTFALEEEKIINYSEKSNLDYKVYLKENEFYEEEYLPKGMLYVANLIDKIKIDFNYKFFIEEQIDLNFEYELMGKLIIQDELEKNTYYEKVYKLLDKKSFVLIDNNEKTINEKIDIDYNKYNTIANNFKNSYGLNTKSKLVVYFNVNKDVYEPNTNEIFVNNSLNNMVINIPLSEKSVNIKLDYKDINNQSWVLDTSKLIINNIMYLVVAGIAIVLAIIFMIRALRLLKYVIKKRSEYDKYIKRILSEYDRLIVETTSAPLANKSSKTSVINIERFTELLDVRDNLKQPILYYVVKEHQECNFYINNEDKIYLTVITKNNIKGQNEKK